MKIATIVSSNSHVDYVARVVDAFDAAKPPTSSDYGFGTFVRVEIETGQSLIGTVYNSLLVNPEYAQYGPRLSSKPEIQSFSPDFLNEQGCLLGILLLGATEPERAPQQGIPSRVIPAGADVGTLEANEFVDFHRDASGGVSLYYFSHLMSNAGVFAVPLVENIIGQLMAFDEVSQEDKSRLTVLKRSLAWQRTVGQMRL